MKQRSTTPVSNLSFTARACVVAATILTLTVAPFTTSPMAKADQYDSQINAIQSQINQYQSQANKLNAQTHSLQAQLDKLSLQKQSLQKQIDLTQLQYDQLNAQIKKTEKDIAANKDALGQTMADVYLDDDISPLEMLASSQNIGDYVDKQAYNSSIQDQLTGTITKINDLKTQLETDKTKVTTVLTRQKAQRTSLAAKEQEQANLVAETKGKEAAYDHLVATSQAKLSSVAAQQRAYYQSLLSSSGGGNSGVVGAFSYSNWSGNQGCGGGYPYCSAPDSTVDPWGLYNRECVSYVAWALSARFGKYVGNFSGQGNAYQWPSSAPAYSGAHRVYSPQAGDAVILPQDGSFAPIGHAMIVESVSGNTMHVSQYNFYGTGEYSTMDIQNSGVILLRFPNR